MSILSRLASSQNINNDLPNQALARELAASGDAGAVRELAENLSNRDKAIQSDCIKTLYEIGYIAPALLVPHAAAFLQALRSRNNRLVWGGMIALSTIGAPAADELFPRLDEIRKAMDAGSVITVDAAVLTLAGIASAKPEYNRVIFPALLEHLRTCRPKEVPQHAEKTVIAVNVENREAFLDVLEKRMVDLIPSQVGRIRKVQRRVKENA
jgi:hypothetical protein